MPKWHNIYIEECNLLQIEIFNSRPIKRVLIICNFYFSKLFLLWDFSICVKEKLFPHSTIPLVCCRFSLYISFHLFCSDVIIVYYVEDSKNRICWKTYKHIKKNEMMWWPLYIMGFFSLTIINNKILLQEWSWAFLRWNF